MTALDNNFSPNESRTNSRRISPVEKNLRDAGDPTDRGDFEQTLESLKARKAQFRSVGPLLSRFKEQLTGTNNVIDGVVTGIVSLQGRSAKGLGENRPALLKSINYEQQELQQFDAELKITALL
jgi:hypothetical protein